VKGPRVYQPPISLVFTSGTHPSDLADVLEAFAERLGRTQYGRAAAELRRPNIGQRSAATMQAIAARDAALREMATFFEGSVRKRCADMIALLERYQAAAWRRVDMYSEVMPLTYEGTPFACAWRLMRIGAAVPRERAGCARSSQPLRHYLGSKPRVFSLPAESRRFIPKG
jgi:hypothetical protein